MPSTTTGTDTQAVKSGHREFLFPCAPPLYDDPLVLVEGNGGPGGDLLAGDTTGPYDDYELVTLNGVTGSNGDVNYAALLPTVEPGTEIDGLTLNEGDDGDWYIISATDALTQFGSAHSGQLTRDMIQIIFDDPAMDALFHDPDYVDTNFFLFAGRGRADVCLRFRGLCRVLHIRHEGIEANGEALGHWRHARLRLCRHIPPH